MSALVSHRRSVAMPIMAFGLIFLVATIIAIINSDKPAIELSAWVLLPPLIFLWAAIPLGATLLVLGVRLKRAGDHTAIYGFVLATGIAMILLWFGIWVIMVFRSFD